MEYLVIPCARCNKVRRMNNYKRSDFTKCPYPKDRSIRNRFMDKFTFEDSPMTIEELKKVATCEYADRNLRDLLASSLSTWLREHLDQEWPERNQRWT